MLRYEDCVAFCALSEDEIAAIAAHEGIPELAAAELGAALLQRPDGVARIQAMIAADIKTAQRRRNYLKSTELKSVLRTFVATHAGGGAGPKDRA
jgi:hypothetical protein